MKRLKVAIGLSGGVDSAVSAYLLKQQGYEVVGVHMKCWDSSEYECNADQDRADAVNVAAQLGIKMEVLDFVKEYKSRVMEYFYKEYELGRTPNPDIMCNKEIKFGLFLDWALKNGFDKIATGHYACVTETKGIFKLLKGADGTKDQSYFLYLLGQEQLAKVIFPVGDLKKSEVRKVAKNQNLAVSSKPDSMGICFVGEVNIKDFLKKKIKTASGNVVNETGEVIGKHDGLAFYTIGQRHGFKVEKYTGIPMYVIGKNTQNNELIVGFIKDVGKTSLVVSQLHWIYKQPADTFDCDVRIRNLGKLYPSTVDGGHVFFKEKVFGVAPGQSAVFYVGDEVIGGGIIEN